MKERWIVPGNTKFFNVVEYLNCHDEIVFRKISSLKNEDIVYIYITAPYSEIKYKGHVICDDVSDEEMKHHQYAIPMAKSDGKRKKYFKVYIDFRFDDGTLKWDELKAHGLGQTQMQARTDRRVQSYIDSIEEGLKNNGE